MRGPEAVAYYRVSTARQGESGYGLDAQRVSVEAFARNRGLVIIDEYQEIETGTSKRRRPQLEQALAVSKSVGATLLIAKLDRLARNVAFVSALMESGVDFIAVDMPEANKLTVHIMAALAEWEAGIISQRTKEGLAAARRRGVKLGKPENLTEDVRLAAAEANVEAARHDYRLVYRYVAALRRQGLTYRQIADRLNDEGMRTRQGQLFAAATVWRIIQRGAPIAGSPTVG